MGIRGRDGSRLGPDSAGLPILSLVTVRGPSMVPALHHGHQVLARRVRPGKLVRTGAVVLVMWGDQPGLLAVKRVVRSLPGGHWVEGDNPYASDDSRRHGPATVLAVVLGRWRPWPPWIPATLRR